MFKKNIWFILAIVGVLTLLAACGEGSASESDTGGDGATEEEWPEKLVIGQVPSEDEAEMNKDFEPFRTYLEDRLGIEVELFVGTNYTAVIEAMRNGHVDVGTFGAFSYVLANQRANAESFVTNLTDPGDEGEYYSLFITLKDSGIESIEDLEGRSFVFADSASTSGYLFPRAHLIRELGLDNDSVDNYFSDVAIAGPQEAVFLSVLNGDAEAGTIADLTMDTYKETHSDHPELDNLVVFETTSAIPRGASSFREDLPQSLKDAIEEAYLDVINVPEMEEYLDNQNMRGGYIPADDSRYEIIRETAELLDLDLEEME